MTFSEIFSNTTYCFACTHLIAVHKIFQLKCFLTILYYRRRKGKTMTTNHKMWRYYDKLLVRTSLQV